jgi:fluoroacetyl-CoA thioesterase
MRPKEGFMAQFHNIKVGDKYLRQYKLTSKDTPLNYGDGNLKDLFSTGSLSTMMLHAATQVIDQNLQDGIVSIGSMLQINHEEPTLIGMMVTVEAVVKQIDDSKILVAIKAYDEIGSISHGLNERKIIDLQSLMKVAEKRASILGRSV